jgi:hypothetical protein
MQPERVAAAPELARLAFFVMLDENQLLDEMLAHPSESVRYCAAVAEFQRRSTEEGLPLEAEHSADPPGDSA